MKIEFRARLTMTDMQGRRYFASMSADISHPRKHPQKSVLNFGPMVQSCGNLSRVIIKNAPRGPVIMRTGDAGTGGRRGHGGVNSAGPAPGGEKIY